MANLVQLQGGEKIAAFAAVRAFDGGGYVLLATRKGIVKKTELQAFSNPRAGGIIALGVEDDDALIEAVLTSGKDEVLLGTREGMARTMSVAPAGPYAASRSRTSPAVPTMPVVRSHRSSPAGVVPSAVASSVSHPWASRSDGYANAKV